jgi:enoyl-CoA hydratase/carnithine racemase
MKKSDREIVMLEYRDTVALIVLNRSVTNALNLEFVNRLTDVLNEIRQDQNARSVVLFDDIFVTVYDGKS